MKYPLCSLEAFVAGASDRSLYASSESTVWWEEACSSFQCRQGESKGYENAAETKKMQQIQSSEVLTSTLGANQLYYTPVFKIGTSLPHFPILCCGARLRTGLLVTPT